MMKTSTQVGFEPLRKIRWVRQTARESAIIYPLFNYICLICHEFQRLILGPNILHVHISNRFIVRFRVLIRSSLLLLCGRTIEPRFDQCHVMHDIMPPMEVASGVVSRPVRFHLSGRSWDRRNLRSTWLIIIISSSISGSLVYTLFLFLFPLLSFRITINI